MDRDDLYATAAHWYGHLIAARPHLLDHNADPTARTRYMRVLIEDAKALDRLVGDDTPPAGEASQADTGASHDSLNADQQAYLLWIENHGGEILAGSHPVGWSTKRSVQAWRSLLLEGLIETRSMGGVVSERITERGRRRLELLPPAGEASLAETDAA